MAKSYFIQYCVDTIDRWYNTIYYFIFAENKKLPWQFISIAVALYASSLENIYTRAFVFSVFVSFQGQIWAEFYNKSVQDNLRLRFSKDAIQRYLLEMRSALKRLSSENATLRALIEEMLTNKYKKDNIYKDKYLEILHDKKGDEGGINETNRE